MREIVRAGSGTPAADWETLEWLVSNGLGGYAFGTVSGLITRSHYRYLIAPLAPPLGRMMMLNDVIEQVRLADGRIAQLGGEERAGLPFHLPVKECLRSFCLDDGLPEWQYELD